MPKVAVILSGCGVKDGAEIHEAVSALLSITRRGAEYVCYAPDKTQHDVVDHLKQAPVAGEQRNVLVESARIARGEVRDLAEFDPAEVDALVIPGGFGSAKNLSDYALQGPTATPDPHVARAVRAMHAAGKPVGAICISPTVVAAVFQGTEVKPRLTIGSDPGTAGHLRDMGAEHVECAADDCIVDETNRIVSTPAYMSARNIAEVYTGIDRLVEEVLKLA
ncbi:MAG: isoprenoid biosynthesis glyoxalase ElbB [Candidatus Coatesbacteria bacterium]|nr:isoprenoid biosynthesis glyoxalase ElbB [Candidatus Coatesbacteria bacterium]